MANKTRFRILSLDGGGLRGVYAASFLARLEQLTGRKTHECFDLITGTSTGGIIALGVALGIPAEEIKALYLEHGPRIFPRRRSWLSLLTRGAKHDPAPLESALRYVFEDRLVGHCQTRVCIPAITATTGAPRVFKTSHHSDFRIDHAIPAWKVAMATSAAPLYLPGFQADEADPLIDGGLWANNPAMVGVFEAVAFLHKDWGDLDVLSIGTGAMPGVPKDQVVRPKPMTWIPGIFEVGIGSQAQAANYQLGILQREKGLGFVRHAPELNGRTSLDDASALERFAGVGDQDARVAMAKIEPRFFSGERGPFEPVHGVRPLGAA